ncbi:MAG: hypothetical protein V4616_05995 [Bacteroidota bacterium]
MQTTSRKCPNCGTWNTDTDHCESCDHLLNYQVKLVQEQEQREQDWREREKDKMDLYLARFRNSRYWPVKVVYYILYSVWFLLFTIVSFLAFVVLSHPG